MKVSELTKNIEIVALIGEDVDINSISYSTADIKEGSLLFCIEGMKIDGHSFAKRAVELGAEALVVSKDVGVGGNTVIIKVKDTREAMALISSNFYGNPSNELNIIGITGTNGKTTSTFLMKSVLEISGRKSGLVGTIYDILGDEIEEAKRTTPESPDLQRMFSRMKNSGLSFCVMEVSSHSLELRRVFGVDFRVSIFTNLTQDHLDFHKTMENYFESKLKLFKQSRAAAVNVDDAYGSRISSLAGCETITYGIEQKADVWAENIIASSEGTSFMLCHGSESVEVTLHLPGKFNVYNALGCAAAGIALGIGLGDIRKGLEAVKAVPGRSEKINSVRGFTVVIDYAHTPDGIVNILGTAREYTKGRLITLFGCGGDRDKTKRPLMGKAAGQFSDYCIITSDNPRTEEPMQIINDIIPGIKETGCNYVIIEDRKEAIKEALKMARSGDVVVIAGKGHETYQVLRDKIIHFDEKEIVKEYLEEEL